jgi:hypothetical protein
MIELLGYLEANGFTSCIASGGDRDFMRPITETLYGIPSERALEQAKEQGWTVVSIKHDWATVFDDTNS